MQLVNRSVSAGLHCRSGTRPGLCRDRDGRSERVGRYWGM